MAVDRAGRDQEQEARSEYSEVMDVPVGQYEQMVITQIILLYRNNRPMIDSICLRNLELYLATEIHL